MTNDIVKKSPSPFAEIAQALERGRQQLSVALPRHLSADRLIRVALSAVKNNPLLLECSRESLLGCVMQCAQLGLEPDGLLGHAYLVPYRSKRGMQAQLIVGYRGLIELAMRSGRVESIEARVVREGDVFEYELGLDKKLRHVPSGDPSRPLSHAYAIARIKGSGPSFEVMSRREIDVIRAGSRGRDQAPWTEHFEEMARKTVIRRLCKYLPLSAELSTAVTLDESADAGVDTHSELMGAELLSANGTTSSNEIEVEYVVEREPGQEG